MKLHLIAVGKAKKSSEKDLVDKYLKRLRWVLNISEIEIKKKLQGAVLQKEEAKQLFAAIPKQAKIIVLDERGDSVTSEVFAKKLGDWQDMGISDVAFLIGGADGHLAETRKKADMILSLGQMTWPHMLARAMLTEQIYRAEQIIAGHPYHRA